MIASTFTGRSRSAPPSGQDASVRFPPIADISAVHRNAHEISEA